MQFTPLARKIKHEAELSTTFAREIGSSLGNDTLSRCIQCGTCSATCPLSIYMDYTPRRIIAMTRSGFERETLESFTIWLCASCYACTVDCPKEIKITDIMYTLKRQAIDAGIYPRHFRVPVLAREFFSLVLSHGRNSEGRLLLRTFLKSRPWQAIRNRKLGMKLWSRGRISLKAESIEQRAQLDALMNAMDNGAESSATGRHE